MIKKQCYSEYLFVSVKIYSGIVFVFGEIPLKKYIIVLGVLISLK